MRTMEDEHCEPAHIIGDGFVTDSSSKNVEESNFLVAVFLKHYPVVEKELGVIRGASPVSAHATERRIIIDVIRADEGVTYPLDDVVWEVRPTSDAFHWPRH